MRSRRPRMRPWLLVLLLSGLAIGPGQAQGPDKIPGEKYALLVGVREYDPNELRTLPYSEPDVVELAQVLRDDRYRRVVLMTVSEGGKTGRARYIPLAANVRKELKGLLEDRDASDSVLIAFAGHGVQFRGEPGSFFCPMDAKLSDRSTLISLDEVYKELEQCGAGVKMLLVDACRNDPQADNSRSRASVRLESLTRPQVARPPGGVAALFSCSPGERAFEHDRLKHGVFYYYVIQGLKGEADFDRDGRVGVEELALFTKKRVPDFVKDEYGPDVRQMPVLRGEVGGLSALVGLGRPKEPDVPAFRPAGTEEPKRELAARTPSPITPRPEPAKTLTNSLGMKLVLIPAGEFLMGSPDEDKDAYDDQKPQHRVKISKPFYLGTTEVTVGQFRRVVESAGYRTEAETDGKGGRGWDEQTRTFESPDPKYSWRFTGFEQTDEHPVVNVTWNDAIAFCNELSKREGLKPYYRFGAGEQSGGDGYRLPTEAEWEYACRAGSTTKYGFGDDASELGQYAWYAGNSGSKMHPVGQKRPNGFGLFDMHGNVWEWCWDWNDSRYYSQSPDADPAGPSQASVRVLRGGGWLDNPRSVRSAYRLRYAPDDRFSFLGFRVARVPVRPLSWNELVSGAWSEGRVGRKRAAGWLGSKTPA